PHGGRPRLGDARADTAGALARGRVRAADAARGGARSGGRRGPRRGRGSRRGADAGRGAPAGRKLFAIVGRGWRPDFLSPLGYVMLAAFLLMNGWIFSFIVNYLNSPGTQKGQALQYLFTNSFFWFYLIFVVPIIAMRLFAEERKAGTLEVLLTSPVS